MKSKEKEKLDKNEETEKNTQGTEIKEEIKIEPQIKIIEQNLDYKDKYLRSLAEIDNARKRMQKEKMETISYISENTIGEFLPVLDNFENALKFSLNASDEVKNWAAGFNMILSQFKDVLHSHGIVAFHSEGNQFDPHFHEAMEIVETFDHPDGTILEELSKGYKKDNRTIRPARVKVAKMPKKINEKPSEETSEEQELNNITTKEEIHEQK